MDDGCGRECEPDETISPHDDADEESRDVEDISSSLDEWQLVLPWENLAGYLAQLHNPEAALSKRSEWQKAGYDDSLGRKTVGSQAEEVESDDTHGQRHSCRPKDVRYDYCNQFLVIVRYHASDNCSRGSRDDRRYDWEKPGSSD